MPAITVNALETKSFNEPDEKRRPPKTEVDVVNLGNATLGRFTFEPGWRWSEHLKPIAGTDNCQATGKLTITQSPAAGTVVGPGIHNVTITVTDAAGNAKTSVAVPITIRT